MFELLVDPQTYVKLITLTSLEIVLGVDNILFISIVSNLLPEAQRTRARRIGLALALFGRLALLFSLNFVNSLKEPLFSLFDHPVSGKELVLGVGGLFLLYKATQEIYFNLEGRDDLEKSPRVVGFASAIAQIVMLDIIFSLDSIITAVGLVQGEGAIMIMVAAVVISVIIMLFFSEWISQFLDRHPSMKMLGLAFLLLVSVLLIAESMGTHVPRGYVYFALGFSVLVEVINIRMRKVQSK